MEICKQQSEIEMRHLPVISIYGYVVFDRNIHILMVPVLLWFLKNGWRCKKQVNGKDIKSLNSHIFFMKILVDTRLGAECEAGCGNRVQRARSKVVKKGQPAWKFGVGSF